MTTLSKTRKPENKFSEPLRWLGVFIRTGHIGFAAIVFGSGILGVTDLHQLPWQPLAIGTGLFLLVYEWLHDPNWPHCGKAIAVYLHILCLLLIHLFPAFTIPLLWCVICIGSIGSHMPRHFRHWSFIFGRYTK